MATNTIADIDRLKVELDDLRPPSPDAVGRLEQKMRIEWNYHSNAIEGNTLTLGETRTLILHGLTARGKPMRDHLDIKGHDDAVKAIEQAVEEDHALNQAFIRNLHRILLKEPYEMPADTPDGRRVMRPIAIGRYKEMPNNVRTRTGEMHYFAPPEQVQPMMSDLIDWSRAKEAEGEHPIVIAATFHYRFVQIHPFDDGNGRMARLLMNLILMRHGYTIAMVQRDGRDRYIAEIEQAQATGSVAEFIQYIAECCRYSLELHLRAARGESIEEPADIDREIAVFKHSMVAPSDEGIPLQFLVASVVLPLYSYLQEKTRSMTVFSCTAGVGGALTTVGREREARAVRLPFTGKIDDLPRNAMSLRVYLFAHMVGYWTSDLSLFLEVTRREGGEWTFSVSSTDLEARTKEKITASHASDDLGELKKCVDHVIRQVMATLKKVYGQPRSQAPGEPA